MVAMIDCIIIYIILMIFFGKGVQALKGILQACQKRLFIGLLLGRLPDSFIACALLNGVHLVKKT